MKVFTILILVLISIPNLIAQEEIRTDDYGLRWHLDFEKAQALSKEEKKPMLIYFTGSDWCGACILLEKKFFSTKQFKKISQHFILIEFDFIKDTFDEDFVMAHIDEWRPKFDIKEKYNVTAFPTTILLDNKGNVNGRIIGYLGDKSKKKYLNVLNAILDASF
ncbi:thioredoxin family protein [uncultured Dokdonia sp.]|uniref:thioredoxin family protein n=1 Tax=uncultured Dokdonia sp. TaxID=575653 RepID=UPI00260BD1F5|nr:thioredoxin family protein [uncultured Dokdonia sp.]